VSEGAGVWAAGQVVAVRRARDGGMLLASLVRDCTVAPYCK